MKDSIGCSYWPINLLGGVNTMQLHTLEMCQVGTVGSNKRWIFILIWQAEDEYAVETLKSLYISTEVGGHTTIDATGIVVRVDELNTKVWWEEHQGLGLTVGLGHSTLRKKMGCLLWLPQINHVNTLLST